MKVRALQSFVTAEGRHEPGDVIDMEEAVALVRLQAGLVARVVVEPRTATKLEPETAVTRKGRR